MDTRDYLKRYAYVYCYAISLCLLAASLFRHGVQTVSSQQAIQNSTRVVIDAGHGGIDGGTTSISGILEKELNLQITLRLEKLLLLLGVKPELTRTDGEDCSTEGQTIRERKRSDLNNRLEQINRSPNTVLVSIHQNHYPDSRYAGPQVFHAGDQKSQALAQALQNTFNASLGTRRECKKADGIYLMRNIRCPGILVECGFLSNYEEEAQLRSPEHQKKLCCLIVSEVMKYVKTPTV